MIADLLEDLAAGTIGRSHIQTPAGLDMFGLERVIVEVPAPPDDLYFRVENFQITSCDYTPAFLKPIEGRRDRPEAEETIMANGCRMKVQLAF